MTRTVTKGRRCFHNGTLTMHILSSIFLLFLASFSSALDIDQPVSDALNLGDSVQYRVDHKPNSANALLQFIVSDIQGGTLRIRVNKGSPPLQSSIALEEKNCSASCVISFDSCHVMEKAFWFVSVEAIDQHQQVSPVSFAIRAHNPTIEFESLRYGQTVSGEALSGSYLQYRVLVNSVSVDGTSFRVTTSDVRGGHLTVYINKAETAGPGPCHDSVAEQYIAKDGGELVQTCGVTPGAWYVGIFAKPVYPHDKVSFDLTVDLNDEKLNELHYTHSGDQPMSSSVDVGKYTHFLITEKLERHEQYLLVRVGSLTKGRVKVYISRKPIGFDAHRESALASESCYDFKEEDCFDEICDVKIEFCDFGPGLWYIAVLGVESADKSTRQIPFTIEAQHVHIKDVTDVIAGQSIDSIFHVPGVYNHYKIVVDQPRSDSILVIEADDWRVAKLSMFVNHNAIAGPSDECHVDKTVCTMMPCVLVVEPCTLEHGIWYLAITGDRALSLKVKLSLDKADPVVTLKPGVQHPGVVREPRYQQWKVQVRGGDEYTRPALKVVVSQIQRGHVDLYLNKGTEAGLSTCTNHVGKPILHKDKDYTYIQMCNITTGDWFVGIRGNDGIGGSIYGDITYIISASVADSRFEDLDDGVAKYGDVQLGHYRHFRLSLPEHIRRQGLPYNLNPTLRVNVTDILHGSLELFANKGDIAADDGCFTHRTYTPCTHKTPCFLDIPYADVATDWFFSVRATDQHDQTSVAFSLTAGFVRDDIPKPVVASLDPPLGPTSGNTRTTIKLEKGYAPTGEEFCLFGSEKVTATVDRWDEPAVLACFSPPQIGFLPFTLCGAEDVCDETGLDFEYYVPPALKQVNPSSGPEQGGLTVTLIGSHFRPSPSITVTFGSTSVPGTYVDDQTITAVTPIGQGSKVIKVSLNGQNECNDHIRFTFYAAPQVAEISPTSGPLDGGYQLRVTGSSFFESDDIYCRFGDSDVHGTFVSPTIVECPVPSHHSPGRVTVTVSMRGNDNPEWFSPTSALFSYYTVFGVHPPSIPRGVEAQLTFEGRGFFDDSSASFIPRCKFGDIVVTAEVEMDDHFAVCKTPAGITDRAVNVSMTFNGRDFTARNHLVLKTFIVREASPASSPASAGLPVVLKGEGFESDPWSTSGIHNFRGRSPVCRFGVEEGSPSSQALVVDDNTVKCETPLNTSSGDQPIFLSMDGGEHWSPTPTPFTFYSLSHAAPLLGPRSGGTKVVLFGDGLEGRDVTCRFGEFVVHPEPLSAGEDESAVAANTSNSASPANMPVGGQLICKTPPQVREVATLRLMVDGHLYEGFERTFKYFGVTKISPSSGWEGTATPVTVTGYGFPTNADGGDGDGDDTPILLCRFGDDVVKATVNSETEAVCVAPAGTGSRSFNVRVAHDNQESWGVVEGDEDGVWTSSRLHFLHQKPFEIAYLSPCSGPTSGNTMVLVHGSGFVDHDDLQCKFGDTLVPAQFISASEVRCRSPTGVGPVFVEVGIHSSGNFTRDQRTFEFYDVQVMDVAPTEGPRQGGTQVHLHLEGEVSTSNDHSIKCRFGQDEVPATYQSATQSLTCVSPEHVVRDGEDGEEGVRVSLEVTLNSQQYIPTGYHFSYYEYSPLVVHIDPLDTPKPDTDRDLLIVGGAESSLSPGDAEMTYEWTVVDGQLNLVSASKTGVDSPTLLIQAGSLSEGTTYKFRLTAHDATGSGHEEITVQVNAPPSRGGLSVAPERGTELFTVFTFTMSGWEDVDGPVQYQFLYKVKKGGGGEADDDTSLTLSEHPLRVWKEQENFSTFLPKDAVAIVAYARDAYDCQTRVEVPVYVEEMELTPGNRYSFVSEFLGKEMRTAASRDDADLYVPALASEVLSYLMRYSEGGDGDVGVNSQESEERREVFQQLLRELVSLRNRETSQSILVHSQTLVESINLSTIPSQSPSSTDEDHEDLYELSGSDILDLSETVHNLVHALSNLHIPTVGLDITSTADDPVTVYGGGCDEAAIATVARLLGVFTSLLSGRAGDSDAFNGGYGMHGNAPKGTPSTSTVSVPIDAVITFEDAIRTFELQVLSSGLRRGSHVSTTPTGEEEPSRVSINTAHMHFLVERVSASDIQSHTIKFDGGSSGASITFPPTVLEHYSLKQLEEDGDGHISIVASTSPSSIHASGTGRSFFKSPVIQVSLHSNGAELPIAGLSVPVILAFPITSSTDLGSETTQQEDGNGDVDDHTSCRFWDRGARLWNSSGCKLKAMRGQQVVCSCSHLTEFAVVDDTVYKEEDFGHHQDVHPSDESSPDDDQHNHHGDGSRDDGPAGDEDGERSDGSDDSNGSHSSAGDDSVGSSSSGGQSSAGDDSSGAVDGSTSGSEEKDSIASEEEKNEKVNKKITPVIYVAVGVGSAIAILVLFGVYVFRQRRKNSRWREIDVSRVGGPGGSPGGGGPGTSAYYDIESRGSSSSAKYSSANGGDFRGEKTIRTALLSKEDGGGDSSSSIRRPSLMNQSVEGEPTNGDEAQQLPPHGEGEAKTLLDVAAMQMRSNCSLCRSSFSSKSGGSGVTCSDCDRVVCRDCLGSAFLVDKLPMLDSSKQHCDSCVNTMYEESVRTQIRRHSLLDVCEISQDTDTATAAFVEAHKPLGVGESIVEEAAESNVLEEAAAERRESEEAVLEGVEESIKVSPVVSRIDARPIPASPHLTDSPASSIGFLSPNPHQFSGEAATQSTIRTTPQSASIAGLRRRSPQPPSPILNEITNNVSSPTRVVPVFEEAVGEAEGQEEEGLVAVSDQKVEEKPSTVVSTTPTDVTQHQDQPAPPQSQAEGDGDGDGPAPPAPPRLTKPKNSSDTIIQAALERARKRREQRAMGASGGVSKTMEQSRLNSSSRARGVDSVSSVVVNGLAQSYNDAKASATSGSSATAPSTADTSSSTPANNDFDEDSVRKAIEQRLEAVRKKKAASMAKRLPPGRNLTSVHATLSQYSKKRSTFGGLHGLGAESSSGSSSAGSGSTTAPGETDVIVSPKGEKPSVHEDEASKENGLEDEDELNIPRRMSVKAKQEQLKQRYLSSPMNLR